MIVIGPNGYYQSETPPKRQTVWVAAAVLFAVLLLAYWYRSPLIAIRQMRAAAVAGDAETFNEHVDYPRLRESLKGQLSGAIASRLTSESSGSELAKAGASFGAMLGMAMLDKMVDAFVRPETVMRTMQEGKMVPPSDQSHGDTAATEPHWEMERRGVDRMIAYAQDPGKGKDARVGLVFDRAGFANWKLTEVRLPTLK
jgi:hypothetical protein